MNHLTSFTAGPLSIRVYGKAEAESIIYIPQPEPVTEEVYFLTDEFPVLLASIDGMDWNGDLSPWPAPKVFRGEEDFSGGADRFADFPEQEVFLKESTFSGRPLHRMMAGISMSGLFALYMGTKKDSLEAIASISGSLWFDGFVDYLKAYPLSSGIKKIYLSLGDKEKRVRNPRMAKVEEDTLAVRDIIAKEGKEVLYQANRGNHFVHGAERLEEAVRYLMTGKVWKGPHSV